VHLFFFCFFVCGVRRELQVITGENERLPVLCWDKCGRLRGLASFINNDEVEVRKVLICAPKGSHCPGHKVGVVY
jgi:hypothetical protein